VPKITVSLCDVCGDYLPGGDIPDGYVVSFHMRGWRYLPSTRPEPPETFRGTFDVTVCFECFMQSQRVLEAVYAWRAHRKDVNLHDVIVRPAERKLAPTTGEGE
jgi:hypothetical protein